MYRLTVYYKFKKKRFLACKILSMSAITQCKPCDGVPVAVATKANTIPPPKGWMQYCFETYLAIDQ